jgi:hypothetical protein
VRDEREHRAEIRAHGWTWYWAGALTAALVGMVTMAVIAYCDYERWLR